MLNLVGVVRGEKPGLYLSENGKSLELAGSHCGVALPSRTSTFNVCFPNVETHTHSETLRGLTCARNGIGNFSPRKSQAFKVKTQETGRRKGT